MVISAVIPARLASTRLPRKVLAEINGRPLIWYVWQQVARAGVFDEIIVATDSTEVYAAVGSWGGQAFMTDPGCRSGTERIVSILPALRGDLVINVQGDEPLIDPGMLQMLVISSEQGEWDILTAVYRITDLESLQNPNLVKVARTSQGRALYFSRSIIPYIRDHPLRDWLERQSFWGHIGVYGYRRAVLEAYPHLPASTLETAESLEQLRFLEAGYRIQTIQTDYHPVAVDTLADLEQVRQILGQQR